MGVPNIFNTGRTGMVASRAAIGTASHNISNANTEGFSRQRVMTTADPAGGGPADTKNMVGRGTRIQRVERVNDEYLEKQIRNSGQEFAHFDEKNTMLTQVEDVFNEMNGEGLNRLIARFFNEFRKLANDPDSEAVRGAVRESAQAMINDFKRIQKSVEDVRNHVDARIEGYVREMNTTASEVAELNYLIHSQMAAGSSANPPNDLLDRRDNLMKKLAGFVDVSVHTDGDNGYYVDVRGGGSLVANRASERLSIDRTPADEEGKRDNSLDIRSSGTGTNSITHQLKGGKLGALIEVRDKTITGVLDRLDDLAFNVSNAVNKVHTVGFTRDGVSGVDFFSAPAERGRAAEYIGLSDHVKASLNNIATAAAPHSPGDNRIANAIAGLQGLKLMGNGNASFDDHYNSIVTEVGVIGARTRESLNQQKDIKTQLEKMRDQISGVSIDEETANLMQFQHMFGASAKVIQVADECLQTILALKR